MPGQHLAHSSDTDGILMARSQLGDERAFAVLVRRHTALVERIARPIVRDGAPDVAQATFLSVWQARRQFDPRHGTFVNWLCTIARNRAYDAARGERRHERLETVPLGEGAAQVAATGESPEDAAVRRCDAAAVRRALSGLTPPQRAVLGLAYFGGLTQLEIHEHVGVPLGTVKGRTRLALAAMRGQLAAA